MPYPVEKMFITANRPGKKINPRYLIIHATDNKGNENGPATATNHYKFWCNPKANASTHYVVDWGRIINTVPEGEEAYHVGGKSNMLMEGIEMCEPWYKLSPKAQKEQFEETWKRTAWLAADYLKRHKWGVDKLKSHCWESKTYGGTHSDPIEFFKRFDRTWDNFVKAVELEMQDKPYRQRLQLVSDIWAYDIKTLEPVKKFVKNDFITAVGIKPGWYVLDINGVEAWIPSTPCKKID